MSNTENADKAIELMLAKLVAEYEMEGFMSRPTAERKSEIIKEIAMLRASMNPQSETKK
jgi:hypothetical protein